MGLERLSESEWVDEGRGERHVGDVVEGVSEGRGGRGYSEQRQEQSVNSSILQHK